MLIWKFFAEKFFSPKKIFAHQKKFFLVRHFFQRKSLRKSIFWRKIENSEIFGFFRFFRLFSTFFDFRKDFLWKKMWTKKIFGSKKNSAKNFQIDITSSDLNEFWIGQKIWRAAPVLFLLSTGFMGVGAKYRVENQKKVGANSSPGGTSFFPRITLFQTFAHIRRPLAGLF